MTAINQAPRNTGYFYGLGMRMSFLGTVGVLIVFALFTAGCSGSDSSSNEELLRDSAQQAAELVEELDSIDFSDVDLTIDCSNSVEPYADKGRIVRPQCGQIHHTDINDFGGKAAVYGLQGNLVDGLMTIFVVPVDFSEGEQIIANVSTPPNSVFSISIFDRNCQPIVDWGFVHYDRAGEFVPGINSTTLEAEFLYETCEGRDTIGGPAREPATIQA